jgi:outer membrane protein insertion porin family
MLKLVKPGIWYLTGFLLAGSPAVARQAVQQAAQPSKPQVTIERIDIRGNRRIKEEDVRFYIQSRPGDVYDEERLQLDLKALYKEAKWFEKIQITAMDGDTGKIVTFLLEEKPLIREIKYTGNKSFTESNILDHFKERKIGITVDSVYEPAKTRAAERGLRELLLQNGKPLGTVRSEIETVPPSSVRLKFIIDEGPKVRIGSIRFVGNKVFSDEELKTSLKLTKERGMVTMFKGTDKYHKEKLEYDLETNLRAFYQEHGYMQVQIGDPLTRIFEGPRGMIPLLGKTKEQFLVEIPIDAGEQFHIGELKLNNCGIFKCEALLRMFALNKGDVLNYKKVKATVENIKKLYGNYGFIDVELLQDFAPQANTKTVDLSFDVNPGKQFLVHRINFDGNTKTRDKVMRREFNLEEGRVFSSQLLDVSIQRLNMLGYFEKIEEKDYTVTPDQKTAQVDVNVKVKEKSQQSIGLTGGISGISGSFIGINYQTNNFMGRGESLEFALTAGTRQTDFIVTFNEPYLLDTRWNMGVSIFNSRNRFDTYSVYGYTDYVSGKPSELFTQKTTGVTLNFSRSIGRSWWRLGASYTYQNISIKNIAPGYEAYALGQFAGMAPGGDATAALSGIIRSEVTPSLSYNSTNAYFNPTRGTSINMSLGIAGSVLGGDFNLIRPTVEVRHFLPDKWLSNRRNTIGIRLVGQYVKAFNNSTVPFFDRFFIGGETTIRGFDIRSISPLAVTATSSLDAQGNPIIDLTSGLAKINRNITPIGGDITGMLNAEYRIPIAGPLTVAAFFDMGMTSVTDMKSLGVFGTTTTNTIIKSTNYVPRSSTGVEISFMLPMVNAPFRLIFAYNPQVLDKIVWVGTVPFGIKEPRHDIKFTVGRSF